MSNGFITDEFIRLAIAKRFDDLVHQYLGGNRSRLALTDAVAFRMIMKAIATGISHKEAAEQGNCREADLLERHREYARSGVLAEFLYDWPQLQFRLMNTQTRGE